MSWGYKILLTYSVFVVGMLFMVYTASQQTNEMEDEKYYVKELAYQQVIDARNNLQNLPEALTILDTVGTLEISLPKEASKNISNGTMEFMRSADKSKDVTVVIAPDNNGRQSISKDKFIKGEYKLRMSWQSNNVPYYKEELLFVK